MEPPVSSPSDRSYEYTPLAPNSTQVRMLKILPLGFGGVAYKDIIQCTLKMVDLGDYTARYKHYRDLVSSSGKDVPVAHDLGMWQFLKNIKRHQAEDLENVMSKRVEFITGRTSRQELPFERDDTLSPRFNWGDYIALSYVWGTQHRTRDILLDGHRFRVGENLHECLVQLRTSVEVRQMNLHVWCDAICINQADLTERAVEVKKMSVIYSSCLYVWAWLGRPAQAVEMKLQVVKDYLVSVPHIDRPDRADRVKDIHTRRALYAVTKSILAADYWQRLRVMQEIALGPFVLFWHGPQYFTIQEIGWQAIVAGMSACHHLGDRIDRVGRLIILLTQLRASTSCASLDPWHICDLVELAGGSKATDARDKVFGILALLPKGIVAQIHPTYTSSATVEAVYRHFFEVWYFQSASLAPLARLRNNNNRSQFPSWMYDLDAASDGKHLSISGETVIYRNYQSNIGLRNLNVPFSFFNKFLSCLGSIIGQIVTLGPSMRPADIPESYSDSLALQSNPQNVKDAGYDAPRAIVRVILDNADFEFSDRPSLLDVPWPMTDSGTEVRRSTMDKVSDSEKEQLYEETELRLCAVTTMDCLFVNQGLIVNGKPLKDYFCYSSETCLDPRSDMELGLGRCIQLMFRRLFVTQDGKLGSGPENAQCGDRIAVLTHCDMPLVLRPRGAQYEVVGGCFIDGWMKGEAAVAVAAGQLEIETITLC